MRRIQLSYNGGEVTPQFWGRIDDPKYQSGLALCLNAIPLPHGPVQNRAGFRYVRATKNPDKIVRLIPFDAGNGQSFAIEVGEGYFRFHKEAGTVAVGPFSAWSSSNAYLVGDFVIDGGDVYGCILANTNQAPPNATYWTLIASDWSSATAYSIGDLVQSSGTIYYCVLGHTNQTPPNTTYWYAMPASGEYEIPNGYFEADLMQLHYVQSKDVLTIVNQNYKPSELKRLGSMTWVFDDIAFAVSIPGPATVTATTSGSGGSPVDFYTYKITAIDSNEEESAPTASAATGTFDLSQGANHINISWAGVTGAQAYNVYRATSYGSYGYIGQTTSTQFVDSNYSQDMTKSPPVTSSPFSTDYPRAVSYYQQRRGFAGTTEKPQTVWLTRSNTEKNLSYSIPSQADDAINITLAALKLNTIEHLVPLNDLIALTGATEFRVGSINSDAITPDTINVRPQSYVGSTYVQPVIVNSNLIFNSVDGKIREFVYSFQINGYLTGNLSVRAPHLFDGYQVLDMAQSKDPTPIVWCVSSSGMLLGLTYLPEQQVGAWHKHTTDGTFESICVIREGTKDYLYASIKREVDGDVVRYIERMENRNFDSLEDTFCVDSGLTYSGAPNDTFSGLDHLEGKEVSILGDGAVFPRQTVVGGSVTINQEVSTAQIGLPYNTDIQTLPFDIQIEALAQGRTKNVNAVWLKVFASSGIFAGPGFGQLTEYKQRTFEPPGTPPALKTGDVMINVTPSWNYTGQLCIRQSDPLPLTILATTLDVVIGS